MAKVNCTVRQASSNVDAKHYDTERIRKEYLVQNIMVPGEINMVYSMFDRIPRDRHHQRRRNRRRESR